MSTYVVKLGGHALEGVESSSDVLVTLAKDLVALVEGGDQVVLTHGGGPQISSLLEEVGVVTTFHDGLRVTDSTTMRYVAMALELVNTQLVAALSCAGLACVGLSGADGSLLRATSLGPLWQRAGSSPTVRRAVLDAQFEGGWTPVVCPLALDDDGALLNCNADTVAGALAAALGAEALVLLSDVEQLRRDPTDVTTALDQVDDATLREMLTSGSAAEGMRPKARAALDALDGGAQRVIIASGLVPHALAGALRGTLASTEVYA